MEYVLLFAASAAILIVIACWLMSIWQWAKGSKKREYRSIVEIPSLPRSNGERLQSSVQVYSIVHNAGWILQEVYAGRTGSRREMASLGMSERQWRRAVHLLKLLKIIERDKPIMAERYALKRLQEWQAASLSEIAHSPAFVLPV